MERRLTHNDSYFIDYACGHSDQQLCTGAVPWYLSVPGRIQEAGLRCRYGCSCNVRNAAGDGCDLADPDVRIKYFQHRLSADAGIHPGNRISGTAGRNDAEEIQNITDGYNYVESLFCSIGAGLGFLLAMVLFAGLREKLENCKGIPECFQGVPITLITASILSMAFMAFSGVVDGIFG